MDRNLTVSMLAFTASSFVTCISMLLPFLVIGMPSEAPLPTVEAATRVPPSTPTATLKPDTTFRVAAVLPGPAGDLAGNQAMAEALEAQNHWGDEKAFEMTYRDDLWRLTEAAEAIDQYAAGSYDLIIAHGEQYLAVVRQAAIAYPYVSFALLASPDSIPETMNLDNIFLYSMRAEEAGYFNGQIAGYLTESDIVGMVGAVAAGEALRYVQGFILGVQATNPDAEIPVIYTGSFGDRALAAEAARLLVDAGADVLAGYGRQVSWVVPVIEEAGGYYLASQFDQTTNWPDTVAVSTVYYWEPVVTRMIEQRWQEGVMGGQSFELTLANGGLHAVYNNPLLETLPESASLIFDQTVTAITNGRLDLPAMIEATE